MNWERLWASGGFVAGLLALALALAWFGRGCGMR